MKPVALSLILLALFQFRFHHLFPNAQGLLGHDYSFLFTALLDGLVWFKKVGLLPMWFSPSGCGGMVRFASPVDLFYSIPQFTAFWLSPINAVRLSVFLFGLIGYSGWYLFSRRILKAPWEVAFAAATIFLFNDFFFYRMVIGHTAFHSFMTAPWLALFLLRNNKPRSTQFAFDAIASALILSYMIYSGSSSLLFPMFLATALLCISSWLRPETENSQKCFWMKAVCVATLALAISASKIIAIESYMVNLSRTLYPLPGFASFTNLLHTLASSLFWSPGHDISKTSFTNSLWLQDRHEFEFGLTPVPILVILAFLVFHFKSTCRKNGASNFSITPLLFGAALIALSAIPLALNFYTPEWNAFLKDLPIIKSASSNIRWFVVYIPLVVFWFTVALTRLPWIDRNRFPVALSLIVSVLALKFLSDTRFYEQQSFNPSRFEQGSARIRTSDWTPVIEDIGDTLNAAGKPVSTPESASSILDGWSNLHCYDPTFGYRLESLPFKTLRPGPVYESSAGWFNFKNPACYLFPADNRCSPGDHFKLDQREPLERFTRFEPFPFKMSLVQSIANLTSVATLALTLSALLALAVGSALCYARNRIRNF